MTTDTLRNLGSCATPQDEYWYHVASQEQMPLAGTARVAGVLDALDAKSPAGTSYTPGTLTREDVAQWLYQTPAIAHQLRLVLSLSDKRFYLDLSYLFSRNTYMGATEPATLCGCLPHTMKKHSTSALLGFITRGPELRRRRAAAVVADYLVARRLLVVLDLYFSLDATRRRAINDLWLAPHDVQQNETKRRGHGAEGEVAAALQAAGLRIEPETKALDPMGAADPNVDLQTFELAPRVPGRTLSADIGVLDGQGNLAAMVMGLVQSSDPGQFGVDKAATNRDIRQKLDDYRTSTGSTLEMWGIVDGIGYAENPNGTVLPMLGYFHEFIQHHSVYKALLAASRLGLCEVAAVQYDSDFYSDGVAAQMHQRYGGTAAHLAAGESAPTGTRSISAGRATVFLRS
ncbi:hypothetical protein [Cellulomonas gilvus]|uniref:hypothetical protein n=1 Tax=Cellulomonas gilvus TaxID=11 RepID=UPI00123754C7|nr:hypothetical protein [Cellulomonas gilvus]